MHVSFINKLPILISHYLYRSDQTVLIGKIARCYRKKLLPIQNDLEESWNIVHCLGGFLNFFFTFTFLTL